MENEILYRVPLWEIFVIIMILCLAISEFCAHRGRVNFLGTKDSVEHFNEVLPTSILGLLALLLGFTFSMAISRFDLRQSLVMKEANALGTVYLRTQTLPEPTASRIRADLKTYTQHRVQFYPSFRESPVAYQNKSQILQNKIWQDSMEIAQKDRGPLIALYLSSLNDLIDTDGERVFANQNHVPELVYFVIMFITILGLGSLSYISGYRGQKKIAFYFLSFLFPIVIVLIMDLDRPGRGLIRVSETSLVNFLHSLESATSTSK